MCHDSIGPIHPFHKHLWCARHCGHSESSAFHGHSLSLAHIRALPLWLTFQHSCQETWILYFHSRGQCKRRLALAPECEYPHTKIPPCGGLNEKYPPEVTYLNTWSLGDIWEVCRTSSLARGSVSLGPGSESLYRSLLVLCFLSVVGDGISQFPAPAACGYAFPPL